MTVLEFAKQLLSLNPENNASRLSLYHYLKNLCDPNEPVNEVLIDRFYRIALSHTYFQNNKNELSAEIKSITESLLSGIIDQKKLIPADEMQVLVIENIADHYEMIKTYMTSRQNEAEKIRILPDSEEAMIGIRLHANGDLSVTRFDKLALIRKGKLVPLNENMTVVYDSNLELKLGQWQHIQVQPGSFARFRRENTQVIGRVVRGYVFQKLEEFAQPSVNRVPLVFYPLKRIEKFFINRASDPLYRELTQLLDQAILLLKENHLESIRYGRAAHERGQNALRLIFQDDNVLAVLLRELENQLTAKAGSQWQTNEILYDSIDT